MTTVLVYPQAGRRYVWFADGRRAVIHTCDHGRCDHGRCNIAATAVHHADASQYGRGRYSFGDISCETASPPTQPQASSPAPTSAPMSWRCWQHVSYHNGYVMIRGRPGRIRGDGCRRARCLAVRARLSCAVLCTGTYTFSHTCLHT